MIPKIIHYCWFGGNPLPKLAKKCINSWKKYCPDYKIIEWNESNYDISSAPLYVRQAYEAKRWGFVPDYIRAELIYKYGGIYLDTDVEIIKPIDDLLTLKAFFGFETDAFVALGLGFGGEKGLPVFEEIMAQYENLLFKKENGSYNLLPSPQINTKIFIRHGLKTNNKRQLLDDYITIFPKDFFSPRSWENKKIHLTKNTYTIHHFAASWITKEDVKQNKKRQRLIQKNKRIEKRDCRLLKIKARIKKNTWRISIQ